MNLIIDNGNTQVKTAIFKENILIDKKIFSKQEFIHSLKNLINKYPITHSILSSVGELDPKESNEIKKIIKPLFLDSETKVPFKNLYKSPKTLGVDRIALVTAAVNNYKNKNVLVIDAGSCITYDYVNKNNEYIGGAISPGIDMRYKSLNTYTANLPRLSLIDKIPEKGDSTNNSIHIGILNGVIQEIEGTIAQFKAKNKKLTVVLTGGDTIFLAKNIKSTIFAIPNFLLEGLNHILFYNLGE